MTNPDQLKKIATGAGFFAALDQSGGSTPQALELYGIGKQAYSGDGEMFDLVHQMRTRIITSPSFDGDRVLGSILFEQTMDRSIDGVPSAQYLWQRKQIVPFLKIDQGLAPTADGVRCMKPIRGLEELLGRAAAEGIFGTKTRSLIQLADQSAIAALLDQQFEYARQVLRAGLVPIIEPEVDIASPVKADAEALLLAGIIARLEELSPGNQVMLKLSLPSIAGYYGELTRHPQVLRVLALSGGYSRAEANRLLAANPGMIASFSRALLEGLRAQQSDAEFHRILDRSIASIYAASMA
jgi:fructose-bisphosphate aldolase class I